MLRPATGGRSASDEEWHTEIPMNDVIVVDPFYEGMRLLAEHARVSCAELPGMRERTPEKWLQLNDLLLPGEPFKQWLHASMIARIHELGLWEQYRQRVGERIRQLFCAMYDDRSDLPPVFGP